MDAHTSVEVAEFTNSPIEKSLPLLTTNLAHVTLMGHMGRGKQVLFTRFEA